MRRDRVYLLRRKIRLARRMRAEFGYSRWYAWQTAGLIQRTTLRMMTVQERVGMYTGVWDEAA